MSEVIGRREILDALARIRDFVRLTPVLELEPGALGVDEPVALKLEHTQATGSFKLRGAFNTLLSAERLPEAGVVVASGGNHGAAVAFAARGLG
ncbi:MAG: pyridoxal-phosphate dependent enzyme, partial [Alphaproteobacteria bacterium]